MLETYPHVMLSREIWTCQWAANALLEGLSRVFSNSSLKNANTPT